MELKDFLSEKKAAILKKWFDVIVETYPSETASFLKRQKNQFTNPVGHTILQGMDGLLEGLINGTDSERVSSYLDNVIRIRAIQDFTPSQAIAFIFGLKKIIREELEGINGHLSDEVSGFDSRIDVLALMAFDIYMKCREEIYEIRANEVKNNMFMLLQRANLYCDVRE
ncbi:MAG: RsbRD N-terminal domain-containing protein [Thermodesulfovibrionales bacterium]